MTQHRSWTLLAVAHCGGCGLWFVLGKQRTSPGRIADQILADWVDARQLSAPFRGERHVPSV
jgi:hypothetical protein